MLRFYCDALGMNVERELDIGLVQLRAGAHLIDLVPCESEMGRRGGGLPAKDHPNMDHFCLRLERFDETELRAHLATQGIEAGPSALRYGAEGNGPSLYIRDPDGNTVELKGPPGAPEAA